MEKKKTGDRRDFLKVTGATLIGASLPFTVAAQEEDKKTDAAVNRQQPVYLSGCGWNRSLPGVFGLACFAFEMRAELGSTGVGTIRDDVYPEVNSQFQIYSASRIGSEYIFTGEIIASRSPELIGNQITITAESLGNDRGRASLTVESDGDNLVVIAIIMPLIALLLPAVQR